MNQYDDTNRGTLFKNDKGDNPNRPDYTGNINVEGTEYRLSAWLKKGKESGKPYLSLSVRLKDENLSLSTPAISSDPEVLIDDLPDEPINIDDIPF